MENKVGISILVGVIIVLGCVLMFDKEIKENVNNYFHSENVAVENINQDENRPTAGKVQSQSPEDRIQDFIDRVYVSEFDIDQPLAIFSDIKKDSKDNSNFENYFSYVISKELYKQLPEDVILDTIPSYSYDDLNTIMVKFFGEEADGILPKNKSIGDLTYLKDKNMYQTLGRGLQENPVKEYFIDSIEMIEDDLYKVELYDYVVELVDKNGNGVILPDDGDYKLNYQTTLKKVLCSYDYKVETVKNTTKATIYDLDGTELDDVTFISKIASGIEVAKENKNRLYKRTLTIKHDTENDNYILVSSDMVK